MQNITIDGQKIQRSQNGVEYEYTLPGNTVFYITCRRRGEDALRALHQLVSQKNGNPN